MLEPGTHIGDKYRLIEPIGQGGMATVWRAEHITLGRPVAVKFPEGVGTNVGHRRERFLREARMVGTIRHRHVIDVMDFGVTDGGQPYMVMELLEGRSLADRLTDEPPLTDTEIVDILSMTLSGLAAVHDEGIVHRDVKPENIFLVEDADGFFPKILDFGISRGFERDGAGKLTHTGGVVGTPSYMSPEQARGLKDIDRRSDLFSMGVILYECLTGRLPFDSENPGDVMIMIASQDPQPVELLRPDLAGPLGDVIDRALARDRDARFQDAREMRDALDRAKASLGAGPAPVPHQPVRRQPSPSPPTVDAPAVGPTGLTGGYTLPTGGGRRRAAVMLAIGAAVVLIAAGALALFRQDEPEPPASTTASEPPETTQPDDPAVADTGDPEAAGAPTADEEGPAERTEAEPRTEAPDTSGAAEDAPAERRARRNRPRRGPARAAMARMDDPRAARMTEPTPSMNAPTQMQPLPSDGFIRNLDY